MGAEVAAAWCGGVPPRQVMLGYGVRGADKGGGVNIQLPITPTRSGYIYNATSYFLMPNDDNHYCTCELDSSNN